MSSTTKTLELLAFFSTSRPEIGLSQLCRLARRDKATTYRHLQALETAGFVEKNSITRHYRLGPAVLQLAHMREATVPRKLAAEDALLALATATGETSHISVLSGTTLYPLVSLESPHHSIRAVIDIPTLPLHATASGLCALAFGPSNLFEVAKENLQVFTPNTVNSESALVKAIHKTRDTGFGHGNRSLETEIEGLATPLFDQAGQFAGSVSVASVASRFTPTLKVRTQENLIIASRAISRSWGGHVPDCVEIAWAKSLSSSNKLETAS